MTRDGQRAARGLIWWLTGLGLLNGTPQVLADAEHASSMVASRVPSLETGLESDHLTGDWGGVRRRLLERGLHFQAGYTAEWLGNIAGGERRGSIYAGLLELALDADMEKACRWAGGLFHISALYPHGRSLSGYAGDLSTVSSLDAYDTIRLFELWYEHHWGRASLRLGQLAADEEFATSTYGEVFVGAGFGWPHLMAANILAPVYPVAAPGARLHGHLTENLHFQAGVYDGDPGSEQGNRHGVRWRWDEDEGVLGLLELAWKHGKDRLPGTYKLGAWVHTGSFQHPRLDENGLSLADPLSSGMPRSFGHGWGLYVVADQAVWQEPGTDGEQGLGVFLRAGGATPDRNFIQYYADGGLNYTGLLPGRAQDVAGLGVLWVRVGEEARRLSRDLNRLGGMGETLDYELKLELTYQVRVRPWWTVQPDLQLIFHPGGSAELETAVVAGIRSTVIF